MNQANIQVTIMKMNNQIFRIKRKAEKSKEVDLSRKIFKGPDGFTKYRGAKCFYGDLLL